MPLWRLTGGAGYIAYFDETYCAPPESYSGGIIYTNGFGYSPWYDYSDGQCNELGVGFPGEGGGGDGTDIRSLTTNAVSCGTNIIGTSWYSQAFSGWPGCPDSPLVQWHEFGGGSLLQIQLTITAGGPSPELSPPMPGPPFVANIGTSTDAKTPSSGYFDTNGHFDFSFIGTASTTYNILTSSNLVNWTFVGTTNIAMCSTNGSFTDTNVASVPERFYVVEDTNGNYSAPYGFIHLSLSNGYAMIGDPLFNDPPQISNILSNVPNGSTFQLWGTTNWGPASTFSSGLT